MRTDTRPAKCLICAAPLDGQLLELGELPPCNRFTRPPAPVETHALAMAGCTACGLVQLAEYPPAELVVPRVPWIKYTEPNRHLDDVVQHVVAAIPTDCHVALGLGPFEAPLLDRLAGRSVAALSADLLEQARATAPIGRFPYLETVQARLQSSVLGRLAKERPGFGTVSLRYVLEHCHDPVGALTALKPLIAPGGLALIEVPDCSKFLARLDYGFIWEEHIAYFTPETLRALAHRAGYEVAALLSYDGPLEDALVALLRPTDARAPLSLGNNDAFVRYQAEFAGVRDAYQVRLARRTAAGQRIAVFGAGHQAIMFINALGLAPYVTMLVDDDPTKQGYAAPGTTMPIVPSAAMLENPAIMTCLLAVGPRAEPVVMQKAAPILARGGSIYSIFPGGSTPTWLESPP